MKRHLIVIALLCLFRSLAHAIESGETVVGNISSPGSSVLHTFTAAAGDTVQIRMSTTNSVWPRVELWSPLGTQICYSATVPGVAEMTFVNLPLGGTYSIICKDGGTRTGSYNLSLLRMTGYPLSANDNEIGVITSGETLSGTINAPGDLDAATFMAAAGDTVQIRMSTTNNVWPSVELRGPNGALLGSRSTVPGVAEFTVTNLPSNAMYTIICKDGGTGLGAYNLSLLRMTGYPLSAADGNIGPIVNGQTLTGTINAPGDLDAATFTAAAGDTVQIRMSTTNNVWPSVELRGPTGVLLGSRSTVPGVAEFSVSNLPTTGTYTILCKDGGTEMGVYTVSLLRMGYSQWSTKQTTPVSGGGMQLLWEKGDGLVSLWLLDSNAVIQSTAAYGPYDGWGVAGVVMNRKDSLPHLVWTNTAGAVSLWKLLANGSLQSAQTFGPCAGWSYQSLTINPTNGQQHLLWASTGGAMSVWTLNSNSVFQSAMTYGPYSGWTPPATITVAPDSKLHLLWQHTSGQVSLWRLGATGSYETSSTLGPVSGWNTQGEDLQAGADNRLRLLWENANRAVSLWFLGNGYAFESATTFGPFSGWGLKGHAVRPDSKTVAGWQNTTGAVALWIVSSTGSFEASMNYGPYTNWELARVTVGVDNRTYLLWTHTSGQISLWRVSATGTFELATSYGPY